MSGHFWNTVYKNGLLVSGKTDINCLEEVRGTEENYEAGSRTEEVGLSRPS